MHNNAVYFYKFGSVCSGKKIRGHIYSIPVTHIKAGKANSSYPDIYSGIFCRVAWKYTFGGKTYILKEGDFYFFSKNQLARFIKRPPPGGEFRSVSVFMDQDTLRSVSAENDLHVDRLYMGENILHLKPNHLFENYINSLTPYLDGITDIKKALNTLKVKEAIMILLETNPALKDVLFDFSEPGKIDLEAYMNEHYKFNVDISRFAYLTGRSLATFKRDFEKIFHTSPNRWLQQKRLSEAYYLIKEKGWKTSDVYLEVGFKDFSHFSFAFKKNFGIAPSLVTSV